MDILKEIGSSRLYNLHSHTQFCDGRADMEDFVKSAIEKGFTHYGFSPHSPIPIESPCNMKTEDVPVYLEEFSRLVREFGHKIKLYQSMEIDYLGSHWGPSHHYFEALPLDYRIGSVHFIPTQEGVYVDVDGNFENFKLKMERCFNHDIRYVVTTFYRQTVDMLDAGGLDIIGHFDKIGHNVGHYKDGIENETWYRRLVYDLMDLIAEKGVVVEINTKAWSDHHRMFPGIAYFNYLKKLGVSIVVNSDAHFPHLINASRNVAFEMLK